MAEQDPVGQIVALGVIQGAISNWMGLISIVAQERGVQDNATITDLLKHMGQAVADLNDEINRRAEVEYRKERG